MLSKGLYYPLSNLVYNSSFQARAFSFGCTREKEEPKSDDAYAWTSGLDMYTDCKRGCRGEREFIIDVAAQGSSLALACAIRIVVSHIFTETACLLS